MAQQARSAMGTEALTALADRGYFSSPEILDCDQAGRTPMVPKPLTSNSKAEGRCDKRDFVYIVADDEYRCPAGQRASKRFTTVDPAYRRATRKTWALLLVRVYEVFPLVCPRCGAEMRIIAFVTDGPTARDAGRAVAGPRPPARARPLKRPRPRESATTSVRSSPLPPQVDA